VPLGERVHIVRPGDCVESIAAAVGCAWRDLWEHPRNASLRAKRENPNLLAPGDLVRLPAALFPSGRPITKGAAHAFEADVPSTLLDVRFVERDDDGAHPLAGVPYAVRALDVERRGTTTSDGRVRESIPLAARRVDVVLHPDTERAREVRVEIGALDPIDEPCGVTQRLQNLGWLGADVSEPAVAAAITGLRRERGLSDDGPLDDATRAALLDAHDGAPRT